MQATVVDIRIYSTSLNSVLHHIFGLFWIMLEHSAMYLNVTPPYEDDTSFFPDFYTTRLVPHTSCCDSFSVKKYFIAFLIAVKACFRVKIVF